MPIENEIHLPVKADFDKFDISHLGPCCEYRYCPEGTSCAFSLVTQSVIAAGTGAFFWTFAGHLPMTDKLLNSEHEYNPSVY
jgi:hypothetical protein